MEKLALERIAGGSTNWYISYGGQLAISKLQMHLLFNLAIPILGISDQPAHV